MKERPLKGGYILISLGLIPLSTSYSGNIDYARISKTKKRVVLTGLKVGGEIKPDVVVQPIYGSGKITFSDVYGFDIEVASTGVVTVTAHKDKGTQLYDHSLSLKGGLVLSFINASNEKYKPLNYNLFEDTFAKATTKRSFISCGCQTFSRAISVEQTGQYAYTFYYMNNGQIASEQLDFNGDEEVLSETVVEF